MPNDISGWLQLLAYGVPVIGGLYAGWRVIRKPFTAFAEGVASISDLGAMAGDIRTIKREVTANGGGSMKDMVRRIEVEGRHREAMLRTHFANANEGQFQTDAEGKLSWANETLQRWTGQPEHALHGKSWFSIIATNEQDEFRSDFELAIAERREFRGRCLIRSISPPSDSGGGRIRHLATDWRVVVVRDPSDAKAIIGFSGNVRLRHTTGPQPAVTDDGA
jgi:PAS domain-containing protein